MPWQSNLSSTRNGAFRVAPAELVCSFQHHGEFNPRLSNVSVFAYEHAAVTVPVMCLQCEEACCKEVCPRGHSPATKTASSSTTSKCIVCKMCVSACPLGNMAFSPRTRKVFKCDMCGGDPQCALFCPTGAILLVDPDEVPKSNLPPKAQSRRW